MARLEAFENSRSLPTATTQLFDLAGCRRKELGTLISHCRDVAERMQTATLQIKSDGEAAIGVKHIEDAINTVKNLASIINNRGFLWSLMNAGKLDCEVERCQQRIEEAYSWASQMFQQGRRQRIVNARELDQGSLTDMIASSQDGNELLRAIQKRESVNRTKKEIVIALRKHVQGYPALETSARAEYAFIHKSSSILSPLYGLRNDDLFQPFVISSVEVEFDINRPIGWGASGKVYKGSWDDTIVAIKRMHADDGRMISREQRRAFYHELKTWSNLRHPNVLPFYGACLEAEIPFLLMKFCTFGTVNHYLEQYPDGDRMKLSYGVASGLAYLHSQGIVHADVKSANVLISDDHEALLSDFGLALRLHQYRSQTSFSTEMDRRRGTLVFMAPEVLRGASPDKAADVYSLGLSVWEMYSDGRAPYVKFLTSSLLAEGVADNGYREERPKRLTEHRVWEMLQKTWNEDPAARPTAKEVQTVLKSSSETTSRADHLARSSLFTNTIFVDNADSLADMRGALATSTPKVQQIEPPQASEADAGQSLATLREEFEMSPRPATSPTSPRSEVSLVSDLLAQRPASADDTRPDSHPNTPCISATSSLASPRRARQRSTPVSPAAAMEGGKAAGDPVQVEATSAIPRTELVHSTSLSELSLLPMLKPLDAPGLFPGTEQPGSQSSEDIWVPPSFPSLVIAGIAGAISSTNAYLSTPTGSSLRAAEDRGPSFCASGRRAPPQSSTNINPSPIDPPDDQDEHDSQSNPTASSVWHADVSNNRERNTAMSRAINDLFTTTPATSSGAAVRIAELAAGKIPTATAMRKARSSATTKRVDTTRSRKRIRMITPVGEDTTTQPSIGANSSEGSRARKIILTPGPSTISDGITAPSSTRTGHGNPYHKGIRGREKASTNNRGTVFVVRGPPSESQQRVQTLLEVFSKYDNQSACGSFPSLPPTSRRIDLICSEGTGAKQYGTQDRWRARFEMTTSTISRAHSAGGEY
ncbi:hypothetical protein NM688_g7346 [Phlebia brevispora]|uniref:Uncharacterized protein n=1 Tax=Phlebia brevispora TaxID=194682 RepID=A0ACC1S6E5_9APHY|nr:hypothetical protein NM688_g7346 [Phlebia brevispora]